MAGRACREMHGTDPEGLAVRGCVVASKTMKRGRGRRKRGVFAFPVTPEARIPTPPEYYTFAEAGAELGLPAPQVPTLMYLIAGTGIPFYRLGVDRLVDADGMDRLRAAYGRYQTIRSSRGRRPSLIPAAPFLPNTPTQMMRVSFEQFEPDPDPVPESES